MEKKNKKGVIAIYLVFIGLALLVILIASVVAPFGVLLNTKLYAAGEDILQQSEAALSGINNTAVRNQINASIQEALGDAQTNIDINSDIFQYGWVIVVILVTLVVFLFTRKTIEVSGGII